MQRTKLSIAFLLLMIMMSSCSVIGDIFQAGMGFGIFLVILVIVVIAVIIMRSSKK